MRRPCASTPKRNESSNGNLKSSTSSWRMYVVVQAGGLFGGVLGHRAVRKGCSEQQTQEGVMHHIYTVTELSRSSVSKDVPHAEAF